MDVWEHEPAILRELVPYTELATPHIAGYSLEGKLMGSYMLYQAYCAHAGLPATLVWQDLLPEPALSAVRLGLAPDAATLKQFV